MSNGIETDGQQVSITVLGLVQLARGRASTSFTEPLFEHSSTSPSAYALALYSGLWAFDGWDQANYVGGEMKNPEKNIPRAIHSSMVVVMVRLAKHILYRRGAQTTEQILFILANVAYFTVLDKVNALVPLRLVRNLMPVTEHCWPEQHCRHRLRTRAIRANRRRHLRCNGSLLLLWRIKRCVCRDGCPFNTLIASS